MRHERMISVVIPVKNAEAHLEQCVRSVFAQNVPDLEIILVDDGSTDATPELIERLRSERPEGVEMRVHRNDRSGGCAAARNAGLALARGKYLFYIDADDWISEDCLREMYDLAEEGGYQVCCAKHEVYFDEKTHHLDPAVRFVAASLATNEEVIRAYSLGRISFSTCNKLMEREIFSSTGLHFEESLKSDEDQLWSFRAVMRVDRWLNMDSVTYFYRKGNPSSITAHSSTRRRLSAYYQVLGFMKLEVDERGGGSVERSRLISRAILRFTKMILWHVEREPDVDYRALYAEFHENNLLTWKSDLYLNLRGKDRFFAWGWNLPYPFCRYASPYFLNKLRSRFMR